MPAKIMKNILKMILSLFSLVYLFTKIEIDLNDIQLSNDWFKWLVLILVIWFVKIFFHSVRWKKLLDFLFFPFHHFQIFIWMVESMFFSQLFVATLGGDLSRLVRCKYHGVKLDKAFSSLILDRLLGALSLVFLVALTIPFLFDYFLIQKSFVNISFIACFLMLFVFLLLKICAKYMPTSSSIIMRNLKLVFENITIISNHPIQSVLLFILSVQVHFLSCVMLWAISEMFLINISFFHCVIVLPIVMLSALIPISIGGWGVRETTAVVIFSQLGNNETSALLLSILFGLFYMVLSVPGVLIWFFYKNEAIEISQ